MHHNEFSEIEEVTRDVLKESYRRCPEGKMMQLLEDGTVANRIREDGK